MKLSHLWAVFALFTLLFSSCEKEKFIEEDGNLVPKTVDQDPSIPAISIKRLKSTGDTQVTAWYFLQ